VPKIKWNLVDDGFCWDALSRSHTLEIGHACEEIFANHHRKFGIRNVVNQSQRLKEAILETMLPVARKHLDPKAFLVRSTLFNKPEESNWAVPWHQDVTIEVQERHEVDGFGPWSTKDGVASVQPPAAILEQMLTLRLHLDNTDGSNGALIVDPGSHVLGKKHISEIKPILPVTLECNSGAVLLMKPLLYHASNRSTSGRPRRILHLDFASNSLPEPLKWMST
jgi:ectoine hydroxylase-related dioxygenase (phytanoyl-CoA dioxygenase family)